MEQVKIWDLFHLFGKRIETDGKEELSVLPEYYEALLEITPQIREQLIESEEYDEKRPEMILSDFPDPGVPGR